MSTFSRLWRNGAFKFGFVVLTAISGMAVFAPWLGTVDPTVMDFNHINAPVGLRDTFMDVEGNETPHLFLLGTDSVGRDLFSRIAYGARISLLVGLLTAVVALSFGVLIGMLSGYFKGLDMVLMRFMDGLMAIPAILLAIALVAALGGSVATVVVAIAIPEIPRVSRLVRSLVLTLREELFVEAAKALATPTHWLRLHSILHAGCREKTAHWSHHPARYSAHGIPLHANSAQTAASPRKKLPLSARDGAHNPFPNGLP
jgi:peptide/nickel transport system permease protein